jgi:Ca-activated chloride channel homolog
MKKSLVLVAVGLVLLSKPLARPQSTSAVTDAGSILLSVTVTDKSERYIAGLDKTAFAVNDNGIAQEITLFQNNAPLSVGIIYDTSGSMSPARSDESEMRASIREGLARLIQSGGPSDKYFLIGFNDKVELLSDWTNDSQPIVKALSETRPKGKTAFHDACYTGLEKLVGEGRQKRVLLIISDGHDNVSTHKFSELHRALRESNVSVYAVGPAILPMDSGINRGNLTGLDELTSGMGGRFYIPRKVASMNRIFVPIFEQISEELHHQYLIGYRPANFTADGKWRRIKIEVKAPADASGKRRQLSAGNRTGYFATIRFLRSMSKNLSGDAK